MERGSVTEARVRDDGKEENQVLLPYTPRSSLVNVYRRLRDDLRRVSCLLFLQSILVNDTMQSLGILSNDDGDGNENGKKAISLDRSRLDWQNNKFIT